MIKRTFNFKLEKPSDLRNIHFHIDCLDGSKKWEVVTRPLIKDRSIPQNKLAFKWYKERGEKSKNGSHYERLFCKFNYGCQLLIEQETDSGDHVFTEFYTKLIERYSYEECINTMEIVEVTSMFKVKTFVKYLNLLEVESVNSGYVLSHPDDCYWEAVGVKRS